MCNLILRCAGVTHKTPIKFRRSLWSRLVRTVGVCPRGAHVRLTGETNENPLSSSKIRVAPNARHFFLSVARRSVSNARPLHRRAVDHAVVVFGNSTPHAVTHARRHSGDNAHETNPRSDEQSDRGSSNLRHSRRHRPHASEPIPIVAVGRPTNGWDVLVVQTGTVFVSAVAIRAASGTHFGRLHQHAELPELASVHRGASVVHADGVVLVVELFQMVSCALLSHKNDRHEH
jgi:hypothetical protein